jgi:hypothetical protein
LDPTTIGAATELGISLPIASNLGALEDLGGTANAVGATESAGIYADAANNRASVQFVAAANSNHGMAFIFMYEII